MNTKPKKKFNLPVAVAYLCLISVVFFVILIGATAFYKKQTRIVLRSDGQFGIQRYYGPIASWKEIGKYDTLDKARASKARWIQQDKEDEAEKKVKTLKIIE